MGKIKDWFWFVFWLWVIGSVLFFTWPALFLIEKIDLMEMEEESGW